MAVIRYEAIRLEVGRQWFGKITFGGKFWREPGSGRQLWASV